jgi:ABC-2 type transport system ATP-binding protein
MVRLESVTKIYCRRPSLLGALRSASASDTVALRDVSLDVAEGKVLALLGPNGSGKTTLLKLVCTMLLPDRGRVLVGGHDTARDEMAVRRLVGFAVASERSFFPRLTARENLEYFATLDDIPRPQRAARIAELLDLVGLADRRDAMAMQFSSGMYQRLGIARALLKQPRLLLLDEPTRSLDPESTAEFWTTLRGIVSGSGATVVLATHNLEEAAATADEVAILRHGRLVATEAVAGRRSAEQLHRLLRATAPDRPIAVAGGSA